MSQRPVYHHLLRVPSASTFALFMCLFVLLEGLLLQPAAAQLVGEEAPDFHMSSLDGTYYSNFKLEGEKALLMFWAPWCGFCRKELPKLAHFYQDNMPEDLQVLAIGTSASQRDVEEYVNQHPKTFVFTTAYDANKTMAEDFRIRVFPTYVLLDRDGRISLIHRGSGILKDQKFHQLAQ